MCLELARDTLFGTEWVIIVVILRLLIIVVSWGELIEELEEEILTEY